MPDPTEPVIIATFYTALVIFVVAAVFRVFIGRSSLPAENPPADAPVVISASLAGVPGDFSDGSSPYQPPLTDLPIADPPPLPSGRVPTWFYHPFDLCGLAFIYGVFFALVVASLRIAKEQVVVLDPANLLVSIGFQFFTAGIVISLMVFRVNPITWLGLKWRSWPWVFLIAPGTVLVMWLFFGGLQWSGYMKWMESLGVESVQDTVKLLQESNDPLVLGLMAFAAVIAAPLCEEIVFRGYLYSAGKRFAGPWASGIASALVFAAAHGSMSALLPLFVFGCVLAFLYQRTGSLWAPIAVHFCFNGATVLVQMGARFLDIPLDATP
jgi:membrane protease YdiL (CAAX protease family)